MYKYNPVSRSNLTVLTTDKNVLQFTNFIKRFINDNSEITDIKTWRSKIQKNIIDYCYVNPKYKFNKLIVTNEEYYYRLRISYYIIIDGYERYYELHYYVLKNYNPNGEDYDT